LFALGQSNFNTLFTKKATPKEFFELIFFSIIERGVSYDSPKIFED